MKHFFIRLTFIHFTFLFAWTAHGQSFHEDLKLNRMSFEPVIQGLILTGDGGFGNIFYAAGPGVAVQYAVQESFAITGRFNQGLSFETGLSAAFTEIAFALRYFVLGNTFVGSRGFSIQNHEFINEKLPLRASLYVELGLDQYFFNGTNQTYPGSGIGLGIGYLYPMGKNWAASIHVGTGWITARNQSLFPIRHLAGVAYYF